MPGNLVPDGRARILGLYKPGFQSEWSGKPWKFLVLELVDADASNSETYIAAVSWSTPTTENFVFNTSAVTFNGLNTSKFIRALWLAFRESPGQYTTVAKYEFGTLMAHTGSFNIGAGRVRMITSGTQAAASVRGTLKLAYMDPVDMEDCYDDTPSDAFTVVGLDSIGGTVFAVTVPESAVTVDTVRAKAVVRASWENTGGSSVQVAEVVMKRNGVVIHQKSVSFEVGVGETLLLTLEVMVS